MSCLLTLIVAACAATTSDASAFRGGTPVAALSRMSIEELRSTILEELMASLGGNRAMDQRLGAIEEAVLPTFRSMPKNEYGNLDHSSVRYVLHRLFVQRHGMYVKGLNPGVEATNASATELLDDRIPAYIQQSFEERLHGRGLGMHEIAILAATLEHLIHNEAVHRLEVAYDAHTLSRSTNVDAEHVAEVVDTYMVIFILGENVSRLTPEIVQEQRANINAIYPTWPATQKFTRDVARDVRKAHDGDASFGQTQTTFDATTAIVEEIGDRYGRWQDSECQDLKQALLKMEDKGTGRVLLKDFYGNALGGAWQFTESVEYLRELGALDESNPNRKSVIISNYINAPTNCLASSGIYSVCCLNECEALLGHIEKSVAEPDVEPQQLFDIVNALPSSTVSAPRAILPELQERLREVARHHGGRVPIHGRLFSQWMHHAYPRECPYPHKSGTTTPLTADQWMTQKGGSAVAEIEDMERHLEEAHTSIDTPNAGTALMWSEDEELIISRSKAREGARLLSKFSTLAFLGAISAVGIHLKSLIGSRDKTMLPYAGKQHFC